MPAGTPGAKDSLISAQTAAQKGDSLINLGKPKTWGNTGCTELLALSVDEKSLLTQAALQREPGADSAWWWLVKPSDKVSQAQLRKCSALRLTLQQSAAVALGLLVFSSSCFSMTTGCAIPLRCKGGGARCVPQAQRDVLSPAGCDCHRLTVPQTAGMT